MRPREEVERIAKEVVDSLVCVHRQLGPGLLETVYQACLTHELRKRELDVRCEVVLPVRYDDIEIEAGYRIDILVEDWIIVENKSVQMLLPVHEVQLMTYLRLSGHRLGFLVNWSVPLIRDGIKRTVNDL